MKRLLFICVLLLLSSGCFACCDGSCDPNTMDYHPEDEGCKTPDPNDTAGDEALDNDPIILCNGALQASVTDIVIPGRMMDIVFTRTYRGSSDEPGFTHTFYSRFEIGDILPLWYNEGYSDTDPNFVPEINYPTASYASYSSNSEVPIGEVIYPYEFFRINSRQWIIDDDCFDVTPQDPNNAVEITFTDYNSGEVTRILNYQIVGSYDPNCEGYYEVIDFATDMHTFEYDISPYAGRLGRKWDHSYNIILVKEPDNRNLLTDNPSDWLFIDEHPADFVPSFYTLCTGNGKRLRFKEVIPDMFVCPTDTTQTLHYTANGFELRKKGGNIWKFNSDLKISKIVDRWDNEISFTYNGDDNLLRVTNDANEYIQFYYDTYNMINYIEDSFDRKWDYNRNGSFELITVEKPILKDGSSTEYVSNTYTYENDHNLLTMTDGANQLWQENIYDANDMIVSQTYGDGDFENVYYFDEDDSNIVDHVLVTDRNDNIHTTYLTKTGLIRRKVVDLGNNETAITSYSYDFDESGEAEIDSKCLVTEIEMPAGDIYEFEYDSWNNTTSITHKADSTDTGLTTQYSYSNDIISDIESITDPQGNTITLEYVTDPNANNYGNRIITLPDDNEYEIAYNTYGQITDVILPNETVVHYEYGTDGWVSDIYYDYGIATENLNIVYSLNYDARGNVTSVTDPDGVETTYGYDNVNRLIEVVDALNSKTSLAYNDAGLVSNAYQQLGTSFDATTAISSSFNYNKVDKLTSITDALGRITEFALDDNDNIEVVTDPQGDIDGYSTNYSYNKLDQVASVQLPQDYDEATGNQNVTSVEYTVDGLVDTVTDAAGEETVYYYDGYCRLIKIEYPDLSTLEYTYDKNGQVVSETKRDGAFVCYDYDALGRLTGKAVNTLDSKGYMAFDGVGNDYFTTGMWIAVSDANSLNGRYAYTQDPTGVYHISASEQIESVCGIFVWYPSFGASSNDDAKITIYDDHGTSDYYVDQRVGGDSWFFLGTRDCGGIGEPNSVHATISANGSTDITSIDAMKFVLLNKFEYDTVGRLTNAPGYEFEYDNAGRLETVTDGFSRETSYEYTDAGRRSKMTWPDGFYVTYDYDEVGRLEAIKKSNGSTLWSCSYDEAGRRVQTTGVYGLVTDYDYEDVSDTLDDERGLYLDSIENTLGTLSLDYDYVRDAVGNIETATTDGVDIKYLYDKNYSLTGVDYATGDDLIFDYDNLSNWTSVVEGSTTTSYTQNALGLNQYSTINTTSLTYDDNGNLTQQGTKHYLYDSENQMIAFYNLTGDPNETAVSLYSYDDFGRRISKASATGVDATNGILAESYVYDGFQVIGEYTSDGQHIKRRFIYAAGIDEPICMVVEPNHQGWYGLEEYSAIADSWLCEDGDACYNSEYDFNANDAIDASDLAEFVSDYYLDDRPLIESTKYYGYVFDGSGNVVALTYCNDPNETGDPNELPYFVETYTYDPFGEPTIYNANATEITDSAIGNPYMFTARRLDNESGLYYYRLRMYSPEVGRFMQTDPIGYYDSMNLYQYCGNNPTNYVDPWGLVSSLSMVTVAGTGLTETELIAMGLLTAAAVQATSEPDIGFWPSVWAGITELFGKSNADSDEGSEKDCDKKDVGDHVKDNFDDPDASPGKDWQWKGPEDEGSWTRGNKEYLRPDVNHKPPQGPHWDYRDPSGKSWRIDSNGNFTPK